MLPPPVPPPGLLLPPLPVFPKPLRSLSFNLLPPPVFPPLEAPAVPPPVLPPPLLPVPEGCLICCSKPLPKRFSSPFCRSSGVMLRLAAVWPEPPEPPEPPEKLWEEEPPPPDEAADEDSVLAPPAGRSPENLFPLSSLPSPAAPLPLPPKSEDTPWNAFVPPKPRAFPMVFPMVPAVEETADLTAFISFPAI